jgi:hypothetical protein
MINIIYYFIYNFDFQCKSKATIMLNSMLPLVGIMNIIKINQYQTHLKNYNGYRMWFNGLNYTKTFSFHVEKYDEI